MTRKQAASLIREAGGWTLVMHFEDGEFGAIDASTRTAEQLMGEVPHNVIGIYWHDQWAYFGHDFKKWQHPAWKVAA